MNKRSSDYIDILVIEDCPEDMNLITDYISSQTKNYNIYCANSCKAAKKLCSKKSFDIIILDINLPDMSGIDFIKKFKRDIPLTSIIIRSGEELSTEAEIELIKLGIDDISEKTKGLRFLKAIIDRSVKRLKAIRYDSMTNTLMKSLFPQTLSLELEKVNKNCKYRVSLVNIDFNKFKEINDKKGHDIGDKVLTKTCSIIQENIRSSDLIFRMGGDEFYILMCDTDLKDAVSIMKRVCNEIKQNKYLQNLSGFQNSISVGIVTASSNENSSLFIKKSDLAMYGAKRKNKDIVARNNETGEYEII